MTTTDIENVHHFVDASLDLIRQHDMMRLPGWIPPAMQDETKTTVDDWLPWKPIDSEVSLNDIRVLERQHNICYPKLYVEFLRYKHFCELWPVSEITFFGHEIDSWKENLLNYYQKSWIPEKLIGQGLIHFADYSDWGIVCFDTNEQRSDDYDCPIIMIDHELLFFDNPVPKKTLYSSFSEMMKSLLEEQKKPTESDEE